MRTTYLLVIVAIASLLQGCASHRPASTQVAANFIQRQEVITTTKEKYPAKNPQFVALFSKEKTPTTPYRVIGIATVSKYNFLGKQREDATLHQMMKNLAASVGGDALINVKNTPNSMQANIITYHRILF